MSSFDTLPVEAVGGIAMLLEPFDFQGKEEIIDDTFCLTLWTSTLAVKGNQQEMNTFLIGVAKLSITSKI